MTLNFPSLPKPKFSPVLDGSPPVGERWADAPDATALAYEEASFTRGAVERVPPTFSSLMRLVGIRPGKSPTASVGLCPVHGLHKANVLFQASNPLY